MSSRDVLTYLVELIGGLFVCLVSYGCLYERVHATLAPS